MNKTLKTMLFIMISIIIASYSTYAEEIDFQSLSVSLINQNPDPVYAGDITEITLGVENAGYGTISNIILEIDNEYPFTVISENQIELASILSSTNYVQNAKFKLKIDSDAKSGDYTIIVKEYPKTNPNLVKEHKIIISVGSNKNVEILSIDKNTIQPGAIEEVTFKIKNVGNSNLKNLEFSWANDDNILLPVNLDNKIFIDSLKVAEEKEITFSISASSAATADLYKLDLTLSYQNQDNSETLTQTSSSGIYVGGSTAFDIIFDETSGTEYVYTIANIGANDATSVKISLNENSQWKTSSKNSEIIGNLNKGDYTTISFEFAKTTGPLIFDVQYTDTSGKRITQTIEISTENLGTTNSSINTKIGTGLKSGTSQTTTTSRNPIGSISSGISTLSTWLKYIGYSLVIGFILFIGFRIYRKKSVSKKRN